MPTSIELAHAAGVPFTTKPHSHPGYVTITFEVGLLTESGHDRLLEQVMDEVDRVAAFEEQVGPWTLDQLHPHPGIEVAERLSLWMVLKTWFLNLRTRPRIKALRAAEAAYFSDAAIEARTKANQ